MKRTLVFFSSAALATMMLSSCAKSGDQAATMADSAKMMAVNNGEANKALVKAFYENVVNNHKVNAMDQYCAATFTDHNPEMGHTGQGLDDNKKSFGEWFASMPDAHASVDNIVADGDMVWALVTFSGTMKGDMGPMKATNKTFKIGGMELAHVKDGKIIERWGYYDKMGMMMQLGLMPMPGGNMAPDNSKKM